MKVRKWKKPSLESAKSSMEKTDGFEVVVVKSGAADKDIRALMKKCLLKKEANFKIQSTSKDFCHNGNVDS